MIATKRAVSHAGEGSRSTHSSSDSVTGWTGQDTGFYPSADCLPYTRYTHTFQVYVYDVCKKEGANDLETVLAVHGATALAGCS